MVVVVAFIAGFLVGVAGDRFYLMRTRQWFPRRALQFVTHNIVDHLDSTLHLSSQQRVEVQGIIDRHRMRMELIMGGVRPQMRQEIEAANGEIEKVLTPAQRLQFETMRMRIRPRMDEHRGPGPHGQQ